MMRRLQLAIIDVFMSANTPMANAAQGKRADHWLTFNLLHLEVDLVLYLEVYGK